jgi:hypothetical protein
MEVAGHSRDEIVAILFGAAMSGNIEKFAVDRGIEIAQLRRWKMPYLSDYVRYLEAVLFRIKDQIDY